MPFTCFSYLLHWLGLPVLWKWTPCLVSNFRVNAFSVSMQSMILATSFFVDVHYHEWMLYFVKIRWFFFFRMIFKYWISFAFPGLTSLNLGILFLLLIFMYIASFNLLICFLRWKNSIWHWEAWRRQEWYHTEACIKSHGELSGDSGCGPHTIYNLVSGQRIITTTNRQACDTQGHLSN